ncbi:hypothetical protein VC585_20720 [Citrobacter freundii]|jgi:hypothetical protein|uniref:Uncharacterized protein n=3 Tax=Citrobacter freundii TaxID=546 RepID=A0AAI9HGM8_CITFR|nr:MULTISPECIES: hypothetical protein [Citrobacter]KLV77443.1 hypothetical protein SK39_04567 [Citrobacter sp. BIDMC107]EKT9265218.1 hypothetical protein [Citrobacter freundii]EKU4728663.1 hypothetical protein [Citrobacter freundii]EKV2291877.1 hypothetical protein [Citrobacter freundii]EKV7199661.1 hypothetical protein [Citrobacter freundii]
MLSFIAKYILTASAVAPVCITLSFVAWLNGSKVYCFFSLSLAILSFLLCWLTLHIAKKRVSETHVNLTSLTPANKEITNYFLAYLFPLITDDKLIENIWLAVFFYISLFVYIGFSGSYSFNPILSFLGYKFYEAEDDTNVSFVLISKKALQKGNVKGLKVVQLTDHTFIKV